MCERSENDLLTLSTQEFGYSERERERERERESGECATVMLKNSLASKQDKPHGKFDKYNFVHS